MNKEQFLLALRQGLMGLSEEDIQNSLDYYAEMIDDRVEEGKSEEEAVAELGNVNEIVEQIQMEMPLQKLVCAKIKPKRELSAWEIVLIVLGFPIWGSLSIAAVAVVFSLFISLWAVLISLYTVPIALAASALGCLLAVVVFALQGFTVQAVFVCGAVFLLAGFAIVAFLACNLTARGCVWCTKMMFLGIKRMFIGKRGENNA